MAQEYENSLLDKEGEAEEEFIAADGGIPFEPTMRRMSPSTKKLLEKIGGGGAGGRNLDRMEGGIARNP